MITFSEVSLLLGVLHTPEDKLGIAPQIQLQEMRMHNSVIPFLLC